MRHLATGIILVLFASASAAEPLLDSPARAGQLNPAETRFIQGALVVYGDYDGLLDGYWGAGSQRSLEVLTKNRSGRDRPLMRDVADLARRFRIALGDGAWQPYLAEDAQMSYLIPRAILAPWRRPDEVAFIDKDSRLVVRTRVDSKSQADVLHKWVIDNALDPNSVYRRVSDNRIVTSALLKNRTTNVYVRSQERGNSVSTTLVQWVPQRASSAKLIVASISNRAQPPLEIPKGGKLHQAIQALENELRGGTKPAPDTSAKRPDAARFSGTGFYINNTDIVTASAALSGCKDVLLISGAKLGVLRNNKENGLALVTSSERSENWIALDRQVASSASDTLTAVGFPFFDQFSRGLTATGGRIQGEFSTGKGRPKLATTLPKRSGNVGAPVFNRDGRLAGVVIDASADETNPNYYRATVVAPVRVLSTMLTNNNVMYANGGTETAGSVGNLMRQDSARAIVPLFCR